MRLMQRRMAKLAAALALAAGGLARQARSQQDNPVYINDSPQAWQQFRRAREQIKDNVGEAVREFQELLDDYPTRLVPMHDSASNQYTATRQRVLAELRGHERLLDRYQQIEEAEARRLLEAGELERLVLTRSLTDSGLEGLLRLAQFDLEAGRLDRARARATEALAHPRLTAEAAAYGWYVQGLAAHYRGDKAAAVAAAAQLELRETPRRDALRAELTRLLAEPLVAAANSGSGRSSLDRGDATDLRDVVGEPIWSKPLDQSLVRRVLTEPGDIDLEARSGLEVPRREGAFLTAVPTVADSLVFINEGHRIRAFNRLTERLIWSAQDGNVSSPLDRESQEIGDVNVVAAGEGAVVTLTGHAVREGRTGSGALVCLDALTGRQRWSVRLDRLGRDEEFGGLFPFGAPIIADGAVFVLGRKVAAQQLASTYLLALNLDDGSLLWSLHVDSSGGLQSRITRPYSLLMYDQGDLYVGTALGAIARIDAATGVTRWLHRFSVPISPMSTDLRPWEIGGPVMTSRGVLAIQPDGRRVVLLDRETGERLESHPIIGNSQWGEPRYLLADDEMVYAVSRNSIRGFAVGNLAEPLWTLLGLEADEGEGRRASGMVSQPDESRSGPGLGRAASGGAASERLALRGRAQLLDGAILAPTSDGLVIIDSETGQIIHRLPQAPIGNAVAVEGQIVLAGEDQLAAYMPLQLAQRMLRERLAAATGDGAGGGGDPEPALALLRLGMRARDLPLALEGAELAWQILSVAPPGDERARGHDELFAWLLELVDTGRGGDRRQQESVFALIDRVATQPAQRVQYLLSYGDWLVPHALPAAVEAYQAVLSDRGLATALLMQNDVSRAGGAWAGDRLAQLIGERGPGVYARESDFAATSLANLLAAGAAAPEALQALAEEFPLAEAAVEASLRAASIWQARGQPLKALEALTHLHRMGDGRAAPRILAAMVELCLAQDWRDQAAEILRMAVEFRGDPRLVIHAVENSASAWLASLGPVGAPPARPLMGDSLTTAGDPVSGQVVPLHAAARGVRRTDALLLLDEATLRLLEAPQMQQRWSVNIGEGGAQALRFTNQEIVLWLGGVTSEPRAVGLNPADGSQRWITPRLSELLPLPAAALADKPQIVGGQAVAGTETIPMLGGGRLVLARRSGGVVAFDAADPERVRWQRERTLDQVHFAHLSDAALVLIGLRYAPAGQAGMNGAILVIDPDSGEIRHDLETADLRSVRWAAITPMSELAYATESGVQMIDLLSGRSLWSSRGAAARSTRNGWPAGMHVIVEDGAAELRSIQCHDGGMSDPFDAPIRGEWSPRDLREVMLDDGQILVRYADRIIRFALDGRRLGADVVVDERDYRWLLVGWGIDNSPRLLAISQHKPVQAQDAERGVRFTVHAYTLYLMAGDCRLLGREINQVQGLTGPLEEALALDQVLALSVKASQGGPARTYLIPMPAP